MRVIQGHKQIPWLFWQEEGYALYTESYGTCKGTTTDVSNIDSTSTPDELNVHNRMLGTLRGFKSVESM